MDTAFNYNFTKPQRVPDLESFLQSFNVRKYVFYRYGFTKILCLMDRLLSGKNLAKSVQSDQKVVVGPQSYGFEKRK